MRDIQRTRYKLKTSANFIQPIQIQLIHYTLYFYDISPIFPFRECKHYWKHVYLLILLHPNNTAIIHIHIHLHIYTLHT